MKKSDREIMEILEAFDATGCAHSAAVLAGVDPKTVRRYVAKRDAGKPVDEPVQRPKLIDPFLPKIEELVETSEGEVRADVVHERLVAMGFTGDERTTRRAVATVKAAYAGGHRRRYRPWITEPGLWLQFDWGAGPIVFGPDGRPRPTLLFCAWLAWSRFRVVIPTWDRKLRHLVDLPGHDAAPGRWGTDLCVDRQREDRDRRARRRGPGAAPDDRRRRPALRPDRPHLCPVRPRARDAAAQRRADQEARRSAPDAIAAALGRALDRGPARLDRRCAAEVERAARARRSDVVPAVDDDAGHEKASAIAVGVAVARAAFAAGTIAGTAWGFRHSAVSS